MQRSYMLTLLQELAAIDDKDAPTLMMGIEEPELYQHPPQARYLAEVLHELSLRGSQIFVCSHSPLFIPGDDFETVRIVREAGNPRASCVAQVKYSDLARTIENAGQKPLKESGMLAKLYPSLNPLVNEMFFCKILILTEGIEDVAYITSYLTLTEKMSEYRRYGCHIVPAGGKSELIKPLAMAKLLNIPVFVIIDADTDKSKPQEIDRHKKDNKAILTIMGYTGENEWPTTTILKDDMIMWHININHCIMGELGDNWKKHYDAACAYYGNAPDLKKNPLAISRALESSWNQNQRSTSLIQLSETIIKYAKTTIVN